MLAVDIGNTAVHVGLADQGGLRRSWRLAGDGSSWPVDLVDACRGEREAALACVRPPARERMLASLARLGVEQVRTVGLDLPLRIANRTRAPREVGADRLVNALAAFRCHGAAIVVDLGTAITFDIVDAEGAYQGGIILPGVDLGLRALAEGTALLPRVSAAAGAPLIGRDTVEALQAGAWHGTAALVAGLAERLAATFSRPPARVLTGGDAEFIHGALSDQASWRLEPQLTLEGLRRAHFEHLGSGGDR